MSFRKSFGIDIKSANEGVWVKYAGDIEFKIKYCKNKDFFHISLPSLSILEKPMLGEYSCSNINTAYLITQIKK